MNFLTICQKANSLCGLQGTVSNTATATGYQDILVEYCSQAYTEIQELRKDWPWMRSSATFNTTADKSEYTLQNIVGIGNDKDIARYVKGMFYYEDANGNDVWLRKYSYDRYIYKGIANETSAIPGVWAEDPIDKHIYINPPDDVYAMTIHYYTLPVTLDGSADTLLLPESFHLLVVYLGAAYMSGFMGNANLFSINQAKADQMLGMLYRSENPMKKMRLRGGAA